MSQRGAEQKSAFAIFGGTFDPIHSGHVAIAEAAARCFRLQKIYFVPSSNPPHKKEQKLAPFWHRYAMAALACAGKKRFVPSLEEGPQDSDSPQVFYSVDTVARFRREHPRQLIYFIVGADSFLEIATWKHSRQLLDSCDFIIANRPGVRMEALRGAIPEEMLGKEAAPSGKSLALRQSTVHLLTTVSSRVSSTEIRQRCKRGVSIRGLVPLAVEDYIHKQALYQ